ncbi:nuclease-related domain-containing protein [Gymnodinialimonas ulvae]|uniref:nuclease-related domain-containing protein n=1 Tax=Gymnodinialimonas ulvae TaxID=3126504 RepID=UPI0030A7DE5C
MEALFFIACILIVIASAILRSPRMKGRAGEARVNRCIAPKANDDPRILMTDVTLPTARGTTQIDHIMIDPGGVFVIETKNMAGWIFGGANQSRWTQTLGRRKTQFQNPLRQNHKHVLAVGDVLGIAPDRIENLAVFVGNARPKTAMPETVFWSPRALKRHLDAPRPAVFTRADIGAFRTALEAARLEPGRATDRAHIDSRKADERARGKNGSACPRCGSDMVARQNRKTGEAFLGCSSFPSCRGIRKAT